MKKTFALLLTLVLTLSVFVLTSCDKEKKTEKILVGVALMSNDNNTQVVKDYLNGEVGPALDMTFDFSEAITDEAKLLDFIENEYAKGAVGIINLYTNGAKAGAKKCAELGLYIQNQKSALESDADVLKLKEYLGNCGASASGMRTAYTTAMNSILGDGEEHNVLLYSCAAQGKAAESHYYSTIAVLEVMKAKYDFDYGEKTVEEIAQAQHAGVVAQKNGSSLAIISGFPGDSITTTISSYIQTGNYDVFVCVAGYSTYTSYIDATEKETKKNIKIVATASIEAQTQTGFTTKDSTGNYVLDAAVINPLAVAYAINAVSIRNAYDKKDSSHDASGNPIQFNVEEWVCLNAADYDGLSQLDKEGTWVISGEECKALLGKDYTAIATKLSGLKDLSAILQAKIK